MTQPAKAEAISQTQLRRAHVLQRQITRLQRELDEILESLLDSIESGAPIEEGTHTAFIETTKHGGTIRAHVKVI